MNNSVLIQTSGAFLGKDLHYVEGPLTIEVTDEGLFGNISRSSPGTLSSNRVLDLRGYVALPPLANLHTHMLDYALLESGWDLDIDSLVGEPYGLKYVLLRKLSRRVLRNAVVSARKLNWAHGVGIIVEFRELGLKGLVVDAEFRVYGHLVLAMPSGHGGAELADEVRELIKLSDGVGISSPLYFSEGDLKLLIRAFKGAGKFVVAHIAETQETYSEGDLQHLVGAGAADAVVHGTFLKREDLDLLSDLGIALILCPRSNMWFSGRLPPLNDIYESGVVVGLGTDNAGWIKPDLWRDMELVLTQLRSCGISDPRWVLKAGTVSAEVFGIENYIGEGAPANLLLLSTEHLGIEAVRNKWLAVVKRGGAEAVGALVVGGEPRYCSSRGETLCSSIRDILSRR
ncbi:MAG: hypothetical protein DRO14_02040 [Thermoprotei archaeon]|nr:MAG: hypothetical protein DRO14_02040 [Thermoprotei archaeon]